MSVLVGWTLFAFGGVYFWGAASAAAGTLILLAITGPSFLAATHLRRLDRALLIAAMLAALQVAPLPASIAGALSPNRDAAATALSLTPHTGARPLSLDTRATLHALLVFGSAIVVFWCARGIFTYGGVRTSTRAVALLGLVASTIGVLQDASRTRLVYWWWAPQAEGPPGFGPFMNRNHFAAWAVMALSLTIGYVAARTHALHEMDRYRSFVARLRRRLDFRTIWLMLAIAGLSIALVLTLSRSGLAAGVAAALAARTMTAGRHRRARGRLPVLAAIVVAAGILWTGPAALVDRWAAAEMGQRGRTVIWRETMPIVKDFWLTGTGAGTYGAAMTIYQRTDRDRTHFNQAHNHYVQLLAEGGVLLFLPLAAAAVFFVRAARERIEADHTGMLWLRVGAAAGLIGLAISSIWETAARMPANALLAALLAAIVLHHPHHHRPASEGTECR